MLASKRDRRLWCYEQVPGSCMVDEAWSPAHRNTSLAHLISCSALYHFMCTHRLVEGSCTVLLRCDLALINLQRRKQLWRRSVHTSLYSFNRASWALWASWAPPPGSDLANFCGACVSWGPHGKRSI